MRDDDPKNFLGRTRPALGSGTQTDDEREAAYAAYLESSEAFAAQLAAKGETAWWLDPERVERIRHNLRLPADSTPEVVRRALWDRRYGETHPVIVIDQETPA